MEEAAAIAQGKAVVQGEVDDFAIGGLGAPIEFANAVGDLGTGGEQHAEAVDVLAQLEVEDACDGIGSVLGGGPVAQDFNVRKGGGGQGIEVGADTAPSTGAVDVDEGAGVAALPVDQDQDLVGPEAAEGRGIDVVGSIGNALGVGTEGWGHGVQQGVQLDLGSRGGQGFHANDVHGDGALQGRAVGSPGAGDEDGIELDSAFEVQVHRLALAGTDGEGHGSGPVSDQGCDELVFARWKGELVLAFSVGEGADGGSGEADPDQVEGAAFGCDGAGNDRVLGDGCNGGEGEGGEGNEYVAHGGAKNRRGLRRRWAGGGPAERGGVDGRSAGPWSACSHRSGGRAGGPVSPLI